MSNTPVFGNGTGLPFLDWQVAKHVSSAFAGATTNAHGSLGEKPTYTIWTVTGVIRVLQPVGVVGTTLTDAAGAGLLEVGVAGNTAKLIAQTDSDLLIATTIWADNAPAVNAESGAQSQFIVASDIIETTSGGDILTGQMDYYIVWAPMESGASLVSAGTLS